MAKTRIEWCDWSINPVKGLCPVDCKDIEGKSYCYARRMYKRFKWDETIRYVWSDYGSVTLSLATHGKRIFMGSTMELFGSWVKPEWMKAILEVPRWNPQHAFIFLTKRPWELPKYNPWPDNCWVGMSATNQSQIGDLHLMGDVAAKVRFVSFEPLLDYSAPDLRYVNWVIIGQQTPVRLNIPESWVRGITKEADRLAIPVFQKNNLKTALDCGLRQEWPNSI